MDRLIIASKNKGKIEEIKEILKELPFEVISMKDAGFDIEVEETGKTFSENALLKAQSLFYCTDEMVIADDSGLEIDYLNGAPGIYTARFAGEHTSQREKNLKILQLLNGVEDSLRTARFVCSIAFVSKERCFTVEGSVEGIIAKEPAGDAGFGYDPIFFVPEYQDTFAGLPAEIKNKISHRARALRLLREEMKRIYGQRDIKSGSGSAN